MGRFARLEHDVHATRVATLVPPVVELNRLRPEERLLAEAQRLHRRARFEPALRLYGRALGLNPNRSAPWLGQVRMLIELGEPEEAAVWALRALDLLPENPDLLAGRAVAVARSGDPADGLKLSDRSLAAPGASGYRWLARGEVLLRLDRLAAHHCLGQWLDSAGPGWWPPLEVARAYQAAGERSLALSYARQSAAADPAEPFPRYVAGECCLALGQPQVARRHFEQALLLDPGFTPATLALRVQRRGIFAWVAGLRDGKGGLT